MRNMNESRLIDRRGFLQALALGATSVAAAGGDIGADAEAIATTAFQGAPHPLDPLTSREIETVGRLLSSTSRTNQSSRFSTIALAAQGPESPAGRIALAVVYQTDTGVTYEHLVDLA